MGPVGTGKIKCRLREVFDQNQGRTVDYGIGIWLHQEASRVLAVTSELRTLGNAWRSFSMMSSKHKLTSWLFDPTSSELEKRVCEGNLRVLYVRPQSQGWTLPIERHTQSLMSSHFNNCYAPLTIQ